MIQQYVAIGVILFFIIRLTSLFRQKGIARSEYLFWMFFWILSGIAIYFIQYLDLLVASLGFSASGIAVLTELAIAVLFYFIFRLRLRLAKMEQDITKIVESISLK